IDAFFLICYSGESCFEHGIMIYNPKPPRYFSFESGKDGLDYTITSLGHPIGLKTEYPASSLKVYKIKLRKGRDPAMKIKDFQKQSQKSDVNPFR
ncbi:hypothetical protein BGZ61DRAFT_374696, partial [Ilyonectria robusta]|uniref:uncharacterized protein n=1 Tax=Ilyonectria robusta TaxID=1079257 RepID=UPI001E8D7DA6